MSGAGGEGGWKYETKSYPAANDRGGFHMLEVTMVVGSPGQWLQKTLLDHDTVVINKLGHVQGILYSVPTTKMTHCLMYILS
jgi:hypothetical protein